MSTITPKILYQNDNFLSNDEIKHYQSLLKNNRWALSDTETLDTSLYVSQDLYNHYKWDGDWDSPRWLDTTPMDWEHLYDKIAQQLPPHYIHWVDVKLTGPLQGGTPIHRDKEYNQIPGGDALKFSKSLTILCNLNTSWDPAWGGGFIVYESVTDQNNKMTHTPVQTIPIVPGQLLIMENCFHSVETITKPTRSRLSFILHVLKYR
jgi:hypothetical protein